MHELLAGRYSHAPAHGSFADYADAKRRRCGLPAPPEGAHLTGGLSSPCNRLLPAAMLDRLRHAVPRKQGNWPRSQLCARHAFYGGRYERRCPPMTG